MLIDLFFKSLEYMLDQLFDEKTLGRYGEKLTERELKIVKLLGRKGRVLKNLYIPKENGETTEIDIVFITQKGIFVIESKNYSGWIFGDESSAYWTAMLPNRQKNRFYSPILQNRSHMKWLEKYLQSNAYYDIPLFSFIVFSERCELKKVTVSGADTRVMKRNRLYANIADVWENSPDLLNEKQTGLIHDLLEPLTKVNCVVKQRHVEVIHQKQEEVELKQVLQICPKCGGKLILRTARKGVNAGNQFYGCSNFPKCRYVQNI